MEHYFTEQSTTAHEDRMLDFRFHGIDFVFKSDSAVFSKAHIDEGSKLLLEAVEAERKRWQEENPEQFMILREGKALDLGCGYGVLGIVCKKLFPELTWFFSDINERALQLAAGNLALNKVFGAQTVKSDGFAALDGRFKLIVSNPPIRIGKEHLYTLLRGAADHLAEDGVFYMVIGKKQGAESCGRYLQELFSEVWVPIKKKGFFIYGCRKTK